MSLQKFGDQSVEQIEHLRCKHRIRVLQGHEDTTKQNVVSRGHLTVALRCSGTNLGVHKNARFCFCTELKTYWE